MKRFRLEWLIALLPIAFILGWRVILPGLFSLDENVLEAGSYTLIDSDDPPSDVLQFTPTGLYIADLEMADIPCLVKVEQAYLDNTITRIDNKLRVEGLKFRTIRVWRLKEPGQHEIKVSPRYTQNSHFVLSNACSLEWVPPE